MNSPFYKQFVDNIYNKRNKIQQDIFEALNNFHPNIKLSIETNPEKFLDIKIILYEEGVVHTYIKKKAVPWLSKITKRYVSEAPFQGICIDLGKKDRILVVSSD